MMLTEESQVPHSALPIDVLKAHLRIGTGFAEDTVQDALLGSFLRASFAAIEARTGKALLERDFLLTLPAWRDASALLLPVAPVSSIISLTMVNGIGARSIVDPLDYRLEVDAAVPRLLPRGSVLPAIPSGGSAELRFVAGYGAAIDHIPSDLFQAVLLLAAHYYEYRDETALSQGCMPFGVSALIARYQPMRLGLNG